MKNLFKIIALVLITSCASPNLVVQYTYGDKALCHNQEGYEVTVNIGYNVPVKKGDTLINVGRFNYYNINATDESLFEPNPLDHVVVKCNEDYVYFWNYYDNTKLDSIKNYDSKIYSAGDVFFCKFRTLGGLR